MVAKKCRICRRRALEDSIFCQTHRQQAAMFSQSFSEESDTQEGSALPRASAEPPDGSAPAELSERRRSTDRTRPESAMVPARDLEELVSTILEEIQSRAAERHERDLRRWPQISIYYVRDRLRARAYYSIVPSEKRQEDPSETDLPKSETFDLTDRRLKDVLDTNGPVMKTLRECFDSLHEDLRHRVIQSLDVQLANYAGVIAINRNAPNQKQHNIATFELTDSGAKTVGPNGINDRLGHTHWQFATQGNKRPA